MPTRSQPLMFAAVVLLCFAPGGCGKGFMSKQAEQRITVSQLPAPVKTTIDNHLPLRGT